MHQHGVVEREGRLQLWESDCGSIWKRVGSCHADISRVNRLEKQVIVIDRKPVEQYWFNVQSREARVKPVVSFHIT